VSSSIALLKKAVESPLWKSCGATFIYLIYAMQLFHILEDARGVKWKNTKTNSLNNHMLNPNVAFLHSYIIFPLNILCAFI
jgi:hypothetical protein